ncbi:hypothetical protein LguiB_022538 [Lonicera macranthoides]
MGSHSNLKMLLFIFHLFLSLPAGKSDLTSDRATLLSLRSAVGGRTLLWNTTYQSPCQWSGIQCDNNNQQVTAIRLPAASLSGNIPVGTIGNLTHLKTLSLRLNSLSGLLPSDLPTSLRNLYLQGNRFSGHLPDFLFGLKSLVRLDLAGNEFSGEISTGFNSLSRLKTLYLENNQLSGIIPDLKLTSLRQFNVSFNQLNGSVPLDLESMPRDSFLGNSLCGGPLKACSSNGSSNGAIPVIENMRKKKKKLSAGAIVGIVVGSILGLVLLLLVLFLCCRKKRSKKMSSVDVATMRNSEMEIVGDKDKPSVEEGKSGDNLGDGTGEIGKKLVFFGNADRVFDLEELLRASAEVLGKGSFGTAYKAVLDSGIVVAVKRLKEVTISENEFRGKIEGVGAMDHENLVPLRAYYYSTEEKLLVYDYMSMGSLSALLHGNKAASRSRLNWETRCGIALGTARGIEYLHSQGPMVSHGNIKSSNILLTRSYDPRLSDFGLAHLVGSTSTPNRVAGYRAPEVTDLRKVSQKADVYSFGVLLLELLTGKSPTNALLNGQAVDLPRWVQSIVREEWSNEVFDRELDPERNVDEEMVQFLQIAIDCAAQYPDNRPSMPEVTGRIEELRRLSVRGDQDSQPDIVKETY